MHHRLTSFVSVAASIVFFFSISFRLLFPHGQYKYSDEGRRLSVGQKMGNLVMVSDASEEISGENSGEYVENSNVGQIYGENNSWYGFIVRYFLSNTP